MNGKLNLVAAGFALTALTYGLARFAYGLMLSDIRADLAISAASAGWIGGSAFAAYCLGITATLLAGTRFSPRLLTVFAGTVATGGLALAATANSALSLGAAMALAGLSTGLTSPPLATAVARSLGDAAAARANGAINSGTAAGIIFSGAAILLFPADWRGLYILFAGIGAIISVWLHFAMPAGSSNDDGPRLSPRHLSRPGTAALCISALLAGAASTAKWTFGANILREELQFSDLQIAIAWMTLGAGGIAGAATGALTVRFGTARIHRLAIGGMALSLIALALASHAAPIGFGVMAMFGLAYIVSSGVLLLWGIELYPDQPALGLGLPFLLLALGQTAGAPLFGTLWDIAGITPTLASFAAIMCTALIWAPDTPARHHPPCPSADPDPASTL
ncbi:MFS transporter [Devosia submarina]|uniref:MFS transporter n=1 Tax=Devosia submarina TaxID=1173082 RepID=UPI000D3ACD4D|nr:MFS transporter [Devosia submarina]